MTRPITLLASAVTIALLSTIPQAAADGDATLELESPLTASGIALKASRTSTDLTFAVEQQLPRSLFWTARLQGAIGDDDSTTLGSRSNGIGGTLKARAGVGWKAPLGSSEADEARCTQLVHQSCVRVVLGWRGSGAGLSAADAEAVCTRWHQQRVVDEALVPTAGDRPPLASALTDHSRRSCALLRGDPQFAEIAQRLGPWANSRAAATILSISLQLDGRVTQVSYHPSGPDGMVDLGRTESWKQPLGGAALDAALQNNTLGIGLGLALGKGYTPSPVEVCRTVTQNEYSIRDCRRRVIGEPDPHWQAGGRLTAVKNPLVPGWRLGELTAGAQMTFDVTTTGSRFANLFEDHSFAYRILVPVFLTRADAPWGVRAGLAAEWSGSIGDPDPSSDDDDLRLLAFVASDRLF